MGLGNGESAGVLQREKGGEGEGGFVVVVGGERE